MEDVAARKLLASCHHLLPADDADVVHRLQLLYGGIGIPAREWMFGATVKSNNDMFKPLVFCVFSLKRSNLYSSGRPLGQHLCCQEVKF